MIVLVRIVVLSSAFAAGAAAAQEKAQPRPAEAILAELDKLPTPDLMGSPAVLYSDENLDIVRKRDRLIEELWKQHPKHDRAPKLMRQRWSAMANVPIAFVPWDGLTGKALWEAMRRDLEGPIVQELDAVRKRVVARVIEESERAIAQDPDGPLAMEAYYPRKIRSCGRFVST